MSRTCFEPRRPGLQVCIAAMLAVCGLAKGREMLQEGGSPRGGPLEPKWSLYQSGTPDSRGSCSVAAGGEGCTLGQSRLSHALPSLRQASRGGAYRDFVMAELQCRQRTEESCGLEGQRAAQAQARERAKQHEQQADPTADGTPLAQAAGRSDTPVTFTSGHSAFGSGGVMADPTDFVFDEHTASLDVAKCRWDPKAGCIAMASRKTLESVVNICTVDTAPTDSRTDGFDVEMDIRLPIVMAAEAECYRHSQTWVGCRAALHGSCEWVATQEADTPEEYDMDDDLLEGAQQQEQQYSESGHCQLSPERSSPQDIYKSLECAGNTEHVAAFSDFLILSEICDSAETPSQCAVLGENQACSWGVFRACIPSLSILLRPLGQLGQRLADDTRSCEQMSVTDGTCVDPETDSVLGVPMMDALSMTRRENPILILAVLIGFLLLGFAALRRFHPGIAGRHT